MKNQKIRPKAYRDEAFLTSSRARPLRVLAEYLEPEGRFRDTRVEDTIVIYGSARIISSEDAEHRLADAKAGRNVMPGMIKAVKACATVGELTGCLVEAYGRYEEPVRF